MARLLAEHRPDLILPDLHASDEGQRWLAAVSVREMHRLVIDDCCGMLDAVAIPIGRLKPYIRITGQVLAQINRFGAGSYLPVLILIADTNIDARNRALGAGAQNYFTKPIDATEARLRIANLLEARRPYLRTPPHGNRSTDSAPGANVMGATPANRPKGVGRPVARSM